MTMNKKRVLKVLLVILLLIACIPFVPPIYNRFTNPLYKNYIDARLWYDKVDCEDLSQVRDYCDRRGYSTDYYILVDFSIPSGKKRIRLAAWQARDEQLLYARQWQGEHRCHSEVQQ